MRSAVLSHTTDSSKVVGKKDTDFSVKRIIGRQPASNTEFPEMQSLSSRSSNGGRSTPAVTYNFTMSDIFQYFFGKARHSYGNDERRCLSRDKTFGKDEDPGESNGICCGVCQHKTSDQCPMHSPLQSLRKLANREQLEMHVNTGERERVTYAVASFPPEVRLCESSIPGHFYGVCARHFIPVGTWIGPYEGVRVSAEDIYKGMDMSYMWEVYQDGRISSYLDGRDENKSSWMRFIRCARHQHEQNLFLFQYGDNIYYRAYKDISPGSELLVWYDDQYEKFLGVPVRLRYVNLTSSGPAFSKDVDFSLSAKQPNYPQSSRVPPTQPLHCDTQFAGSVSSSNDNVRFKSASNAINAACTKTSGESADTKDAHCGRASPPRESSGSLEAGVWRCGQCFKSFTQRSLLQIHVCPRLPEKPYQCGHCSQSYAHPTDLRTHVVTHNSERPFKCGFCGRSFAGSTTLNNHIRTHTGQKPFVCENCSRSFSQASQLSRHQRLPGDCCPKHNTH